jgi:hypothetical protein
MTQKEIYGQTRDSVIADFKRIKPLYEVIYNIYIIGILSDAQLMIETKHYNQARQFINKAKLLLSTKVK